MATLQSNSIDISDIKLRWEEPYSSEGINRMVSVNEAGVYRGGIVKAQSTPDQTFYIDVGPENDTVVLVRDKVNGFANVVRFDNIRTVDMSGALTWPVSGDQTWYVAIQVLYSVSSLTVGSIIVVDAIPSDNATLLCKLEIPNGATAILPEYVKTDGINTDRPLQNMGFIVPKMYVVPAQASRTSFQIPDRVFRIDAGMGTGFGNWNMGSLELIGTGGNFYPLMDSGGRLCEPNGWYEDAGLTDSIVTADFDSDGCYDSPYIQMSRAIDDSFAVKYWGYSSLSDVPKGVEINPYWFHKEHAENIYCAEHTSSSPETLVAGRLSGQILTLLYAINARARISSDELITGAWDFSGVITFQNTTFFEDDATFETNVDIYGALDVTGNATVVGKTILGDFDIGNHAGGDVGEFYNDYILYHPTVFSRHMGRLIATSSIKEDNESHKGMYPSIQSSWSLPHRQAFVEQPGAGLTIEGASDIIIKQSSVGTIADSCQFFYSNGVDLEGQPMGGGPLIGLLVGKMAFADTQNDSFIIVNPNYITEGFGDITLGDMAEFHTLQLSGSDTPVACVGEYNRFFVLAISNSGRNLAVYRYNLSADPLTPGGGTISYDVRTEIEISGINTTYQSSYPVYGMAMKNNRIILSGESNLAITTADYQSDTGEAGSLHGNIVFIIGRTLTGLAYGRGTANSASLPNDITALCWVMDEVAGEGILVFAGSDGSINFAEDSGGDVPSNTIAWGALDSGGWTCSNSNTNFTELVPIGGDRFAALGAATLLDNGWTGVFVSRSISDATTVAQRVALQYFFTTDLIKSQRGGMCFDGRYVWISAIPNIAGSTSSGSVSLAKIDPFKMVIHSNISPGTIWEITDEQWIPVEETYERGSYYDYTDDIPGSLEVINGEVWGVSRMQMELNYLINGSNNLFKIPIK